MLGLPVLRQAAGAIGLHMAQPSWAVRRRQDQKAGIITPATGARSGAGPIPQTQVKEDSEPTHQGKPATLTFGDLAEGLPDQMGVAQLVMLGHQMIPAAHFLGVDQAEHHAGQPRMTVIERSRMSSIIPQI